MVAKLITINGASNTGKTTVSDILTQIRPNTVPIELDSRCVGRITRRLSQTARDHLSNLNIVPGDTILEDSAALAINWIDRGCDVVIPGLLHKNGFEKFKTYIDMRLTGRQVEYYCFHLKPPLEIALQNRGTRILDEDEKEFITDIYGWLYEPSYGIVINNQDQTPNQTVDHIENYIRKGNPEAIS